MSAWKAQVWLCPFTRERRSSSRAKHLVGDLEGSQVLDPIETDVLALDIIETDVWALDSTETDVWALDSTETNVWAPRIVVTLHWDDRFHAFLFQNHVSNLLCVWRVCGRIQLHSAGWPGVSFPTPQRHPSGSHPWRPSLSLGTKGGAHGMCLLWKATKGPGSF